MIHEDECAPNNTAGADNGVGSDDPRRSSAKTSSARQTPPQNQLAMPETVAVEGPSDFVPHTPGDRFEARGISVELRTPGLFETYFQVPTDVITFSLERFDGNLAAYDSDRVSHVSTIPNEMHFHPAGARIYFRNQNNPHSRFLVVEVDPAVRQAVEAELKGGSTSVRTLVNINTPQAMMLSQAFQHFINTDALGGRLAADALATLAITESVRALSENVKRDQLHPLLAQPALNRVLDYIEAHLHEEVRLNELAALACLSPQHFSRAFKASTGRPPSIYLIEKRLERAKHLLLTTQEPVAEIALMSGFSSQSHMTTAFRRFTAMTPAKFRKAGGQ